MTVFQRFGVAGAAMGAMLAASNAGAQTEIEVEIGGESGSAALNITSQTREAASGYVRGCQGYLPAESDGVPVRLVEGADEIGLTIEGDETVAMVVRAPNGTYHCALPGASGTIELALARPEGGRYVILPAGRETGTRVESRLLADSGAATPPPPPAQPGQPAGIDISRLGEPRAGRGTIDPAAAQERQLLASAPIVAQTEADQVIPARCAGFIGADAADFVLDVNESRPELSLYALSETDLTMAVHGPDGRWHCNDDSFQLNPGVTLSNAPAGEYHIWVGAYWQGDGGQYDLFTTLGAPVWSDAELEHSAAPASGYLSVGPNTARSLRTAVTMTSDGEDAGLFHGDCRGYIDPSQPSVTVTVEPGLEQVTIYSVSEADGVMLVRTPSGRILCNDDYQGLNPALELMAPEPGDYAVFVGTYGGTGGQGQLGVTLDEPNWTLENDI